MAPSAIDPQEGRKRTITSARVRTNGITKTTATKPKMNKSAEYLTTNTKAELKGKDMNAVGNNVSPNLRGHFQKADVVKPDVKSNVTTTAAENKLANKIIDQDEDEDAA